MTTRRYVETPPGVLRSRADDLGRVMAALERLLRDFRITTIGDVHRAVPDLGREAVDDAILDLAQMRRVQLGMAGASRLMAPKESISVGGREYFYVMDVRG